MYVSKLWVFLMKVRRSSKLNELLRDRIDELVVHNSPQVAYDPYSVSFPNDTLG